MISQLTRYLPNCVLRVVLGVLILPSVGLIAQTFSETASDESETPNELPHHYSLWAEMMEKVNPGYTAPRSAEAAKSTDSDGDGKSDFEEACAFTDPLLPDRELTTAEKIDQQALLAEQARSAAVSRVAQQAAAHTFVKPWLGQAIEPLEPGKDVSPDGLRLEKRRRMAEDLPALQAADRANRIRAMELAKQMGLPESVRYPRGGGAALSGDIVNGVPQYHTTLSIDAAYTIAVNGLWPGGSSGLNLQGGYTEDPGAPGGNDDYVVPRVRLGVWEVFAPLTTHPEFGKLAPSLPVTTGTSRLTHIDPDGGPPELHATHVSGIVMARGLASGVQGMAPYAEEHSRTGAGDITEMRQIFAVGAEEWKKFFVSNHSYAKPVAWTNEFFPAPTGLALPGPGRYWNTDESISEEDYRYGFYSAVESAPVDDLVYRSQTLLPVWAAGNERNHVNMPEYPTPFWHWEFENVPPLFRKYVNTPPRQDFYWNSGYDTLFPEAVAKNVLTVTSIDDGPWISPTSGESSIFASWGPPDFGHIKPDVAANGEDVLSTTADGFYEYQSGTSMAAPTVTGALGLLVELLQRQYGDDYEPSAALLKALIIAGTDDLGPIGPDYRHGWGQVNARNSAEIVALNGASGGQHIRRVLVQNGVNGNFTIKAKGGEKLIATAVWLDLPGTWVAPQKDPLGVLPTVNQSQSVLKNDIDHKITRSTTSWHPPSLNPAPFTTLAPNTYPPDTFGLPTYSGPNHRDTVEKIIIPQPGSAQSTPTAGHDYTITYGPAPGVTLRNELGQAAPQEMFIVLSGIQVQGTPPFQIVWFEETADDEVTLLWASIPGSTYWVQYCDSLATGSWTDIGGSSLVATTTFAARTVPKNPTGSQHFYRIRKAT